MLDGVFFTVSKDIELDIEAINLCVTRWSQALEATLEAQNISRDFIQMENYFDLKSLLGDADPYLINPYTRRVCRMVDVNFNLRLLSTWMHTKDLARIIERYITGNSIHDSCVTVSPGNPADKLIFVGVTVSDNGGDESDYEAIELIYLIAEWPDLHKLVPIKLLIQE